MTSKIHLLDIVAIIDDQPDKGLRRGQVGTVVETLNPGVFEVEFSDEQGKTYAQAAIPGSQLLVLRYQPQNGVHHTPRRRKAAY
ncbi:MAG TPA: DUF4926 domain-containing protein [Phycisphaerae bacterium]|nr:DUF4926 domain-containing protein [Phycisphaerae bacterium]